MKTIINFFSGISGNTQLVDRTKFRVVNVEYDKEIYQELLRIRPNDVNILGDCFDMEFVLSIVEAYKPIFINFSPPCQSHSRARRIHDKINYLTPDLSLHTKIVSYVRSIEIPYIVENTIPKYTLREEFERQGMPYKLHYEKDIIMNRHYYWSNISIPKKSFKLATPKQFQEMGLKDWEDFYQVTLSKSIKYIRRRQILRNISNPDTFLYFLEFALNKWDYDQKTGGI